MNARRVLLVLQKEVREALRDRRTLFVTLVLPILLYPCLMIGLGAATMRQQGKLKEATQTYALEGPVPAALRESLGAAKGLVLKTPADPGKAVRAGELHLLVRAAPDFAEVLEAGGSARLELVHDSASEPSAEARRKAAEVVSKYREQVLLRRLEGRGIERAYINPVDVPPSATTDVASAGKRGAHAFGRILSMMLVIMVVTGAFTPAVDAVSGEKERGTMETLLVCPATRLEVVLGKFLSVLAVSVATALGNLASMGLTFGQFASSLGVKGQVDFSISLGTATVIFAVLVPMAALFAALALALSTLARSTKEAQTYLTPLMLVALPLAMVSVIPNIELTFGLAVVPISGAVLLFRDLLLAQGEPALLARVMPMVPVVLGSTALAAGRAIRWAVWMFGREEVLFRDAGESFSWKDLRPVRRAGAVPGPGAAFFLPAATLAATFFLAQAVLKPETLATPFGVSLQQIVMLGGVIAAVALVRLDWRATLGLGAPGMLPMAGALLVGCGAPAATHWLSRVTGIVPQGGTGELVSDLVASLSAPVLVLLIAVLPAVAEETLFRGWVLRGLRSQMSGMAAVVISAVIFGAFHLEPERILFTGLLGLALGVLALRSGSLWPGVLAHALNNGILVVLAKQTLDGRTDSFAAVFISGTNGALGIGGLAAVGAGLGLAWWGSRGRDSLPTGASRG